MAGQVGLSSTELAEGMLAIINARMADAMRTITVEQGIDPREFALVAFGGAGPMHAVWLAEELEIGEVIVPWSPGTFSAWGMLQTDMRHDVVRSFYRRLAGLESSAVSSTFDSLEAEGAELLEAEGIGADDRYFARSADMRYVGQEYTVNLPIGATVSLDEIDARLPRRPPSPLRPLHPERPGRVRQSSRRGHGPNRERRAEVQPASRRGRSAPRTADGDLRRPGT